MKHLRKSKLTLLSRIVLFFLAFCCSMLLQMGIGRYQTQSIIRPMEERTENIQTISQLLNDVEDLLSSLENYRWDHGDPEELTRRLIQRQEVSRERVDRISTDLQKISEEQYLLAQAVHTTYAHLANAVDRIILEVGQGRPVGASEIYYSEVQPCGGYLRQYTQQLLEQAILDNQDAYVRIRTESDRLSRFQTAVSILGLVVGIFVVISLSRLLRAVTKMVRASQQISQGNFDVPDLQENQRDEIGLMASAFNEMKQSMRQKVELLGEKNAMERELYQKETEALELQNLMEREKLQQLRSQINPHFLFNTLNVILYTAQQEKASRTGALLTSLSQLFRYALGSNDAQVPLSREVHIVNEFYSLYHVRFGERYRLQWHFDPEVDLTETLVPSFILQPLVENAYKHGLARKEEGGTVDVYIGAEADMLRIRVVDDGIGMSPEALEALRKNLQNPPTTGDHIGMYNVAARLRLRGKRYGLDISSVQGKGTEAVLRIPLEVLSDEEES